MKKFGIMVFGLLFVVNANQAFFSPDRNILVNKLVGYGIAGAGLACGSLASFWYAKQCSSAEGRLESIKTCFNSVCKRAANFRSACTNSRMFWVTAGLLSSVGACKFFGAALNAVSEWKRCLPGDFFPGDPILLH